MSRWKFELSSSHFAAAVAALLVSFGSSAAIIYQAAQTFGASDNQIISWFTIIALVCAILTFALSKYYRTPIMMAWCTPGAALLVGMNNITLPEATAGFMLAALLMLIITLTGFFNLIVRMIPGTLASAMLAGILINFGSKVFTAMESQLLLVGLMLAIYLLSKIRMPRYSILLMLAAGFIFTALTGLLDISQLKWHPPRLEWVSPEFHIGPMISVGIPLFIASLATQNVPGIAILNSYGYRPPANPLVNSSAAATLLLAPFGAFMVNLAAISAAICLGKDVDPDPNKRYYSCLWLGILYLIMALAGGITVAVFTALPSELLAALAGIAIFGTLQANILQAWQDETTREASLVTLLASASGMTLFGIGSAFWGLLLGIAVYHLNKKTLIK